MMDHEEFRVKGKEMIDYIADMMQDIPNFAVVPDVKPGFLINQLPDTAPVEGENWEKIMKDVSQYILPGMTWWQHPNFHAYFPAGNSYPSILGELLSASLGGVCFSWASAPAATELEMVVTDWMARALALPEEFIHSSGEGGGVIQGSASESVLIAMLAARRQTFKTFSLKTSNRLVAYCSTLAHSCVEKAASICNIRLRQIEPDRESWSLRGERLRQAIAADRDANLIPFFVCATLGTTSICSFDHMTEIADTLLSEERKIWLHVDCAYAGNAFICPEFQHLLLDGIEAVDSFEFNANKWLMTNFDCGLMFARDKKSIEETLCVDPLYLQHDHQHLTRDFRNWSIPLSRRFRSLKLWFVIRSYGITGLQKQIRQDINLAKKFHRLLQKDRRFEQVGSTVMALVSFRLKGENSLSEKLLSVINSSGSLFMVPALVNDKYVIRYCISTHLTTEEHIGYSWKVISESADRVLADEIVEMTLQPGDLSPIDLATSSFLYMGNESVNGTTSPFSANRHKEGQQPQRPRFRRFSTDDNLLVRVQDVSLRLKGQNLGRTANRKPAQMKKSRFYSVEES